MGEVLDAWRLADHGGREDREIRGLAPNLDDLSAIGVSAPAFRYYFMTAHYRSTLDLSLEALRAAETGFERLSSFVEQHVQDPPTESAETAEAEWRQQFYDALYDDLDAPRAIAVLWCILADASLAAGTRARLIAELGGVLGLNWKTKRAVQGGPEALRLLEARERARAERDFATADALRAELSSRGFSIEDSPTGPPLAPRALTLRALAGRAPLGSSRTPARALGSRRTEPSHAQ